MLPKSSVTELDLDAEIVAETYHRFPDTTITVCLLSLKNGYHIIGYSACVHPENFDADIGRSLARNDAREQLWPLLGFRLADQRAAGSRH
jgi:hypothetical protein